MSFRRQWRVGVVVLAVGIVAAACGGATIAEGDRPKADGNSSSGGSSSGGSSSGGSSSGGSSSGGSSSGMSDPQEPPQAVVCSTQSFDFDPDASQCVDQMLGATQQACGSAPGAPPPRTREWTPAAVCSFTVGNPCERADGGTATYGAVPCPDACLRLTPAGAPKPSQCTRAQDDRGNVVYQCGACAL